MDRMSQNPSPIEAEDYFRQLIAEGEMEQPDEVEYDPAANELLFFWNEEKVCVVLELDSDAPVEVFARVGDSPPA